MLASKIGLVGLRSGTAKCRNHPRFDIATDGTAGLCEMRVQHRGQLLVVAAKGKGKRSGQSTVLVDEPTFVEEEAPALAPLTFVIEDDEDIAEEVEWAPKAKKGKGKGKKQKKKKADVWDESTSDTEDIAPAAFVVEEIPVEIEEDVDSFTGRKKGKGKKGRKQSSWDDEEVDSETIPYESAAPSYTELDVPSTTHPDAGLGVYEQEAQPTIRNPYPVDETPYPARPARAQSVAATPVADDVSSMPYQEANTAGTEWVPCEPQSDRRTHRNGRFGNAESARFDNAESAGYGQAARGSRGSGGLERRRERGAGSNAGGQGWFDPDKRKAWNDKRNRVFSRLTTQEIYAAGTWQEVADIMQARERILDHIHVTAALTVVSKVVDLSQLQEAEQEQFEQLLADIYRRIYNNVDKLGPRELATNLLSLARLGYTSDEVVQALLDASVFKLPEFNAIELCNAIYALGQMSVVPNPEWMSRYFENSISKLPDFKPLELSNTIHALAQLGQLPPAEWLEAFFDQSQAVFMGFTPRDTATMLFGLGLLGAKPSEGWLDLCVAASIKGLKGARVTDLKRSVWALSQFDYAPDYKWQNLFAGRAKALLDYFSAEDLLTTTLAMAYLRFSVVDAEFMRRLASKLQERRGRYQPEELDNLNVALKALDHKGPAITPAAAPARSRALAAA